MSEVVDKEHLYDQLSLLAEKIDTAYHHAATEFELPRCVDATFGISKDGKNWHEQFSPREIADLVREFRDAVCADDWQSFTSSSAGSLR